MLNWGISRGYCVIPKANSLVNQKANMDIFDFELSEEEMTGISKLDKRIRLCNKMPFMEGFDFFA